MSGFVINLMNVTPPKMRPKKHLDLNVHNFRCNFDMDQTSPVECSEVRNSVGLFHPDVLIAIEYTNVRHFGCNFDTDQTTPVEFAELRNVSVPMSQILDAILTQTIQPTECFDV
ncbi:uncharacterized protein LACBIDRAFT_329921 [Laccaria bicolor S238N-H82]|uniref:Predicted protein n=1 Tax=Laccaria bicolor (strain S238N-H82 / ATCC MYA-4686) TaxID=486041 RepID=B0DJM2_LACBS|nr:uncharacterized protein LACBIDRAFT_329921 [Laccaria bicolor S238N-H82]EDR05144.1 predicted protein [Laccaria bicolor S238N-H82]|eukprot:XP_001884109.1 predicted protein [Laccaria bicolor S238N-H82]